MSRYQQFLPWLGAVPVQQNSGLLGSYSGWLGTFDLADSGKESVRRFERPCAYRSGQIYRVCLFAPRRRKGKASKVKQAETGTQAPRLRSLVRTAFRWAAMVTDRPSGPR